MKLGKLIRRNGLMLFGGAALLAALVIGIATIVFAQGDDAVKLEIDMGEMFFQVNGGEKNAPIVLKAGETYDIVYKNIGTVTHEAQFGRDPDMSSGVAHDYTVFLFGNSEVKAEGSHEVEASEEEGLVEVKLEPGEEAEVIVTVPADAQGEWEIGCFIPGHYEAGMKAPVTVE